MSPLLIPTHQINPIYLHTFTFQPLKPPPPPPIIKAQIVLIFIGSGIYIEFIASEK